MNGKTVWLALAVALGASLIGVPLYAVPVVQEFQKSVFAAQGSCSACMNGIAVDSSCGSGWTCVMFDGSDATAYQMCILAGNNNDLCSPTGMLGELSSGL